MRPIEAVANPCAGVFIADSISWRVSPVSDTTIIYSPARSAAAKWRMYPHAGHRSNISGVRVMKSSALCLLSSLSLSGIHSAMANLSRRQRRQRVTGRPHLRSSYFTNKTKTNNRFDIDMAFTGQSSAPEWNLPYQLPATVNLFRAHKLYSTGDYAKLLQQQRTSPQLKCKKRLTNVNID